jgi:heme/copper-type cytochrome/quinol oxidase subunit 2
LNYEDPFWIAITLLVGIAINLFVVIATPFIKYRRTDEIPEQIGTVPGE